MSLRKLLLRDTFPHRTRAAHSTRNHSQEIIRIICATPLLMCYYITPTLHLRLLDQLAVSAHALLRERTTELVRDQCRGVQARQCDELPAVAQLAEALDIGFLVGGAHGCFPVERG